MDNAGHASPGRKVALRLLFLLLVSAPSRPGIAGRVALGFAVTDLGSAKAN
jgi:hypothetical protein